MFEWIREPKKSPVDEAIDTVLLEMKRLSPDDARYAKMVDQLSKLHKLKDAERSKRVSPDTILIVAGNIIGILVIVGYEHAHVLNSKAMNLLHDLKPAKQQNQPPKV